MRNITSVAASNEEGLLGVVSSAENDPRVFRSLFISCFAEIIKAFLFHEEFIS